MKKKKIVRSVAGLLCTTMLTSFLGEPLVTVANESAQESQAMSQEEASKEETPKEETLQEKALQEDVPQEDVSQQDYYYLSDIPYLEDKTYVGYQNLILDGSASGEGIQLLVDNEVTTFKKGIGAHATSCVVYDISKYSNTQTNFIAYLGVDARQGSSGNGVKFTISVSDDGEHWEDLYKSDVMKGNQNSIFVDLNVKGKKFLKLYADDNGHQGQDHAVYANARLKKADYDIDVENTAPFKRLAEYDSLLSQESVENNLTQHLQMVYEREMVKRVGYNTLQKLYENPQHEEAIEFLRTNPTALAYFIEGGPLIPAKDSHGEQSMIAFSQIYQANKDKLQNAAEDNFYLRLAISIASAYSYPENIRFWMTPNKEQNPVQRFDSFIKLSEPNGLMDEAGKSGKNSLWSGKQFRELPVPLMRWVVDTRMNEDELFWLANYALASRGTEKNFLDAYTYIDYKNSFGYKNPEYYSPQNYEKWNNKYKFSTYFNDYGQDIRRLWIVFEEGAVCGGLAKTYANLAEVFGRPSVVVGQPGHAATVTWEYDERTQKYMWKLQNDVYGWAQSHSEYNNYLLGWGTSQYAKDQPSSYTLLAADAIEDYDNYVKANQYVLLSNSYSDPAQKEALYRKALAVQNNHLPAWEGLVTVKLADTTFTSTQYLNLAKEICSQLKYYPKPMDDLLNAIKEKITVPQEIAEFDLMRLTTLKEAENATDATSTQPNVCVTVAQYLLNGNTTHLASFSFDGENAGKIVLNEKYDGSSIQVRYSLDGGTTWKESQEHKIPLTQQELDGLTAEQDIKVGLVGVDTIYTIDLVAGKSPKQNKVSSNDLENLFVGATEHLEYSQDGGKTWKDYPAGLNGDVHFEGDQTIQIRYKNYGTHLKSDADVYTFSKDSNTPEKTYLPLKNVKLVSFSSQQNEGDQAAVNLIDGNPETRWHSAYNRVDDKEYVVEFAEPYYISALEYLPDAANGRWKDIKVYISMDKTNWEEVASVSLENTNSLKTIPLTYNKQAKYLKIKGLTSWGNTPGEANKFFSGRMLNFYRDTTKDALPLAEVSYSTNQKTNQDVVATLALPEGCQMIEGQATHTFQENGEHIFKYKDKNNHVYEVKASVDWIRKATLTATVTYSTTNPTRDNVVATIGNFNYDDVYIVNKSQSYTHIFTENGEVSFQLADPYGNTGIVTASVSNIDRTPPKAHIEYSNDNWTSEPVTVSLVPSEGETYTILNNKGSSEYTFTENGTFFFEIQDKAGNQSKIAAHVDYIDKAKDDVKPTYSTQGITSEPVTVTLSINPEEHEIVNNNGLNSYTFTKNGTFVFDIRLRDTGKIVKYGVSVNTISTKPGPVPPASDPNAPNNVIRPESSSQIPNPAQPSTPASAHTAQNTTSPTSNTPQTGDSNMALPAMSLFAGIAGLWVAYKKKRQE